MKIGNVGINISYELGKELGIIGGFLSFIFSKDNSEISKVVLSCCKSASLTLRKWHFHRLIEVQWEGYSWCL